MYAIDLNALVRAVAADTSQESAALLAELQKFTSGDTVRVDATVSTANPPSVDAYASANIEWPAQVAKLSVFVTNPNSKDVGEKPAHIAGTYVDPAFDTLAENGSGALEKIHVPDSADNELTALGVNQSLGAENAQAMAQSYVGAWVDMGQASRIKASLQAMAGSYKPNANTAHQYQIWELWVKQSNSEYTRAGYMRDNVWEWYNYAALGDCITWLKADGTSVKGNIAGTNAQDIVSITVDVQALQAKLANELSNLADDTGSVEIYLRTAPKASEVQEHFNAKAATGVAGALAADYLSDNGVESASRRTNGTASAKARAVFENEFGASSSDVAWVVSREARSGDFSQANDFLAEGTNIRVYYSIAPGLGFKNIKEFQNGNLPSILSSVRSTQMTNVALWLYRSDEAGALKAMPEAMLISDGKSPYTCRHGNDAANNNLYDFKLTTQDDYRFYRVLAYYEDAQDAESAPVKLDIPSQYVPHIATKDAVIASSNNKDGETSIFIFKNWKTEEGVICEPGDALSVYTDKLELMGTKLIAQYKVQQKSVGIAYLEFGNENLITGYYGFLRDDEDSEAVANLPSDNSITSWGYYVLVPSGAAKPTGTMRTSNTPISIDINSLEYDAYRINDANDTQKKANQTLTYTSKNESWIETATYHVNFNFAAAVVGGSTSVNSLGEAESPYVVRHASQFPLALKANGSDSVQLQYMSKVFRQTHSIDLTGFLSTDYAYRPNNAFQGTYDGGSDKGFAVTGMASRYVQEFDHRQGLFPIVKNASLNNIKVAVEADITMKWNSGVDAAFGCLAGVAYDSEIKNCEVVSGMAYGNMAMLALENLSPKGGKFDGNEGNNVGGLVGFAKGTSIDSCSVSGLIIRVLSSTGEWTTDALRFGSVVGRLDSASTVEGAAAITEYRALNARRVKLNNEALSTKASQSMGGVVGQLIAGDKGASATEWKVEDVSLEAPQSQERALLRVGELAGQTVGAFAASGETCTGCELEIHGTPLERLDGLLVGDRVA